jgi:hypothetical protein
MNFVGFVNFVNLRARVVVKDVTVDNGGCKSAE